MKEVCYVTKSFGKAIPQVTHSSTDVPRGRKRESHNAICEYHDNCDILLKRYCDNSSDVNLLYSLRFVERRELLLVHFACVQRFVWSQQSTWNDMEKVVNVGQKILKPDAFTNGFR